MAQTDELSARIGEILSSPEQMRQIQSLASMLGLGNEQMILLCYGLSEGIRILFSAVCSILFITNAVSLL